MSQTVVKQRGDRVAFMRRLVRRRWLWISAGLLVAYAAAGFWLVPRLLASAVRDTVAERYHRVARLGAVKFNPFTLELEARDFSLPDADGGPLLAFDRLYVNLALTSLLRAGLDFQAIELDRPRVRVVRRADGRVNLEDLSGPTDAAADPNARPPRLWIQRFAIQAGEATVVDLDRTSPLTLTLRPVEFTLHDFSARGEGNAYVLAVESVRSERLAWRGSFGLSPLASSGSFKLSHVQAQTLAEIAGDSVPFGITGGELDLMGSYVVAPRKQQLQVRLNELSVNQLGLRARGDAQETFRLPKLSVRGTTVDAMAQSVTVEHIGLEAPRLSVIRDKSGGLNLERLLPNTRAAQSSGSPWSVALPEIRIDRGAIHLSDHTPAHPAQLQIEPLNLSLIGFASPARGALAVHLDAAVETGRFNADGQLAIDPLNGRFDIEAGDLPLRALQPYLDDHTGLIVKRGAARLKGVLTFGADVDVAFEGDAGVDDLHSIDDVLAEDFVKWSRLDLLGLRLHSAPLSLAVEQVLVREPYARIIVAPDGMTNIQDVLARGSRAPPPPTAASPAEPTALPIEIGLVRIDDGSLNFSDLSIRPNFATGVQKVAGTIRGLSARPGARADVALAGQVSRFTPVKITGKVNYFAAVKYTKLRLSFRNLELTGLSPYSGKFAGYKIERGKLNVDFNYRVENRRLDAQHKLNVNQLQLGDHVDSPDATSLPVKLAVALLKDRNGVIDLDLPVSGNLDDPQFRVAPILWKALLSLLVKVVTSPFALLGSLFGGGEEISYIDFRPGSNALDAGAIAKLSTLAKALDSRPSLNLDVPLTIEPQVDRAALVDQRWREDISARAAKQLGPRGRDPRAVARLLATPQDYRALLETAYRQQFGHRPEIPPPQQPAKPVKRPPPPPQSSAQRLSHLYGPGHGALLGRLQPSAARSTPPPAAPLPESSARGALASRKATKASPPPVPDAYAVAWLEQQLKNRIPIGAPDLAALAQARADSVQGALLDGTGIDPARVFVITAPPLSAARGPLRMQLALH